MDNEHLLYSAGNEFREAIKPFLGECPTEQEVFNALKKETQEDIKRSHCVVFDSGYGWAIAQESGFGTTSLLIALMLDIERLQKEVVTAYENRPK